MHKVAVVAMDGVVAFDLSTPIETLGRVRLADGTVGYRVVVCGVAPEIDAGAFTLKPQGDLSELDDANTVILPGVGDLSKETPECLLRAVRRSAAAGARIASICTGAFILAKTGLLEGRKATTHWLAANEFARRFPNVRLDPNVLFVDEGQVLTSAGASAGIDLCLHMVRRDYGAAVASAAARLSVMPLARSGGQAQFISHDMPPSEEVALSELLHWLDENLEDPSLTLAAIARRATVSVRTLSRKFRASVGTTPIQWLFIARVRRAQSLLETTTLGVERIAASVGFGSVAAFRGHFQRVVGTSPQAYRRAFQAIP